MIDDEKIIELFFERSEQAIRELDIKYGKICHNLSYNIVNSRQDAEECVNDAYLGAWNAIPPVRPNPLLSYIVKIVRNISLKIYWRKEAAKRSGHYTIALEEIEGCIADQKTVEDEIEARELARIIEAFLDTLTVKERVIFMRRYLHANLPKGTKTLPIAEWEQEYADLKTQRDSDYTKLKDTRAEVAELQKIRKCVDIALRADQPEQSRTKRHEQER